MVLTLSVEAFVPYTNIIHLAVATTKGGISGSLLIKNLNVIEPIESIIPQLQLGLIITPLSQVRIKTPNTAKLAIPYETIH
jgi:hypothetical protein